MKYNPEKHNRRSIRLHDFDYRRTGAYFVTICVHQKECVFGKIAGGKMQINQYGSVVESEWKRTAEIRRNVELDKYVIMPNHFHGIIIFKNNDEIVHSVGATHRVAPTGLQPNSLGAIMSQFKSIVTKNIRKNGLKHFQWQRNYYEHVVRDINEYNRICGYILNNPIQWDLDAENPRSVKAR